MNIQWKTLIICLTVPLAADSLSALLTRNSMEIFNSIAGIASYLVFTSGKPNDHALTIYSLQLVFNFFWSIIFFNWKLYLPAFIWLVLLWLLILRTLRLFHQISKPAGYLMIPYLLWVTFAGYLNFSIYLLN